MGIIAVFVAAILGFSTGAAWYSALGSQWMQAVGRTKEDIDADKDKTPFVIAFLGALLASILMHHMFTMAGIEDALRCMGYGAGLGLFLVVPWIVLHYAFANRPRALWVIDAGHTVAAFAVIGLVLGLFY